MAWEDDYDWYEPEHFRASDFDYSMSPIDATIIKQTEKAYLIEFKNKDTAWVPKSVIVITLDSLYLQDWFFEKLAIMKPVVQEIELSIFSKDELKDFDEPRMTYSEWLEEYKRRQKEEEQNNIPLFQESLTEIELDIFKKDK